MESTTLNRLELTDYEATELHDYERKTARHSFEVGCFVLGDGEPEARALGARLFLELVSLMETNDRIRTGALAHGLFWAEAAQDDYRASQAYRLQNAFLADAYRAAIAGRREKAAK